MRILALETANENCSIALYDQGRCQFFQLDERTKMQTQVILPMIEQCLAKHDCQLQDLTAMAFSRGPGSFSGVRINATVTQALAWSYDIPVISISTLQALAQRAYHLHQLTQVTAVIDARMNEVYLANFICNEQGIMQICDEEKLVDYATARQLCQFIPIGSGAKFIQESDTLIHIMPTAHEIAQIAQTIPQDQWLNASQALPIYLRNDAWKKISEQGKA